MVAPLVFEWVENLDYLLALNMVVQMDVWKGIWKVAQMDFFWVVLMVAVMVSYTVAMKASQSAVSSVEKTVALSDDLMVLLLDVSVVEMQAVWLV